LLTALCPCIRRSRIVNPGTPHASLPGAPAVRPALPPFPTRRSSDLTPRDPPAADVLVRALPGPLLRHRRWWAHQDSNLEPRDSLDRKSTRLNSSHVKISYAVFCLKKNKNGETDREHTAVAPHTLAVA